MGLKHLQAIPSLTWLHLQGTKVTKQGVQELKKALPKTKVLSMAY
jgi:hypothetical protein